MHAQLYPRKYENSIFALQSIEYNIESCSHEREGTKQRKTKLSEIQYTTSWMKYICTWVPIWNAALNLGRMNFAYECIWINHETHEVMISLSHSLYTHTWRFIFHLIVIYQNNLTSGNIVLNYYYYVWTNRCAQYTNFYLLNLS